jgi:hypothetical protein
MNELLVRYLRVSTEQQDVTAQRNGLHALGVGDDRILYRVRRASTPAWHSPSCQLRNDVRDGANLYKSSQYERRAGLDHYAVALTDPEGNEFDIN